MSDLPPLDLDPEMFPDRVSIAYRVTGGQDATGAPRPTYGDPFTGVPCSVQDASVQSVPDLLHVVGVTISAVFWFPLGQTLAASLKRGDLITYRLPSDTADRAYEVYRCQAQGLEDLQLWRADATRRE